MPVVASCMQFTVSLSLNSTDEAADAINYPRIRLLSLVLNESTTELENLSGFALPWSASTPEVRQQSKREGGREGGGRRGRVCRRPGLRSAHASLFWCLRVMVNRLWRARRGTTSAPCATSSAGSCTSGCM